MRDLVGPVVAAFVALTVPARADEEPGTSRLLADLSSEDPDVAEAAERALSARGADARRVLEDRLAPESGRFPLDPEGLRAAISDLGSDDYGRRASAEDRIAILGPRALPGLAEALASAEDPDLRDRLRRVAALLETQARIATDPKTLARAVVALARIGSEASVPVLLQILERGGSQLAPLVDFALRAILLDGPEGTDWPAFLADRGRPRGETIRVPERLPAGLEVRGVARNVVTGTAVYVYEGGESERREFAWSERLERIDRIEDGDVRREHVAHDLAGAVTIRLPRAGSERRVRAGEAPARTDLGLLASWLVPPGTYAPGSTVDATATFAAIGRPLLDVVMFPARPLEPRSPGRLRYLGDGRFGLSFEFGVGASGSGPRSSAWIAGFLELDPATGRAVRYRLAGPFHGECVPENLISSAPWFAIEATGFAVASYEETR